MSTKPGVGVLMFVHSAVDDAGLSLKAFRVLGHLHRRAGGSDQAWPGVKSMAAAIGLNEKTVKRALSELVTAGFIIRESRRGTSTAYRLMRATPKDRQNEADPSEKRPDPENDPAQKATQAGKWPADGPKNSLGAGQKMAHKGNPLKETKEEDAEFPPRNACGAMASPAAAAIDADEDADEAPAPLSPPPPPPPRPRPSPPPSDPQPPASAGEMAGLRQPPKPGPEESATAGSLAPVPGPLRTAGFTAAWASFCRHRLHLWRLNRTPWTRDAAASLLEKCLRHGAAAAVAAIGRTVESGKWTGLYFDAGGAVRGQARDQTPYRRTRPLPAVATLREYEEVPMLQNPFTESRRNRDRLRREQEGEPPPGWDGNDRLEPPFQPRFPFQPWEVAAA